MIFWMTSKKYEENTIIISKYSFLKILLITEDNFQKEDKNMYYEKYKELLSKIKEAGKTDEFETVESFVNEFKKYVDLVYSISLSTPILETKFPSEFSEQGITTLEDLKKNNLQLVKDACDYLNTTCRVYGLKQFCPKWKESDDKFTKFAGEFVAEIYKLGIQNKPDLE